MYGKIPGEIVFYQRHLSVTIRRRD